MKNWYEGASVPSFNRALWIVGTSVSGKSSFSQYVAKGLHDVPIFETGRWLRSIHHPEAATAELTASTLSLLEKDARFFSHKISQGIAAYTRVIVVGARNPIDFVDNFRVKTDAVIFLGTETFQPATTFERTGVEAIKACARFFVDAGLILPERVVFLEPSNAIDEM